MEQWVTAQQANVFQAAADGDVTTLGLVLAKAPHRLNEVDQVDGLLSPIKSVHLLRIVFCRMAALHCTMQPLKTTVKSSNF